ncbi:nucleosome-remodeling factor subunit NURF301 isoform X1 [Drosophila guanche]|uniref:Blast:Nucleosome-remodeling factor subunit NURF301 n=1 Tax=Drosophila guanche TaxID=7266 RepID=A0A3B0K0S3_DROGU|nr:nucleosome-remodeling factor subunit NURF301 isoform X1 [Drosophila guanche]XP_034136469.1 nucleosome-remodeling factor subunit NURF301 isoform X1 [Drosophila guanche]SPP86933.1 blast:Nucleosome-remodeling factor subunit NURF301 [Drosophila guanche]
MSGRGSRKRGRPPKTSNERTSSGRFSYQLLKKPKYLSEGKSQASTPSASRGISPQSDECSRSSHNNNSRGNRGSTAKRGRGRKSNVQPNTSHYSGRKGYESEYHYGSDFGDSDDDKSDNEDDILLTPSDDESLDAGNESESEFSVCSFTQNGVGRPPRPPSPDPIWLQEGREYAPLDLPDSSEDLSIANAHVLRALSIYEVLRRFRHLVRLSPFRFEDFCAALTCDEQSALLTDVHIMLLKAILREEDVQGTHFGPLDQKDTVNISLYLIDAITWPEVLRSYVESDKTFDRQVYDILSRTEYPYTGIENRLGVLQFLADQFLTANSIRDVMLQEGPIHYDDHCRVCHRLGDLLCCETCPAVYHLECVDPPMSDVPTEDWQCGLCRSHKVSGVIDCVLPQEKHGVLIRHDSLGVDRHGRRYWFIARRIFIEDQMDSSCWYYSTTYKLKLLLHRLDSEELETRLHAQLTERWEEIERQMILTESITNEHKHTKRSLIDIEQEATKEILEKETICGSTDDVEPKSDDQLSEAAKKSDESKMVTRQKSNQLNNGTLYFKLGMEQGFKNYVNQYATNPIALNKPQRNEERDKRRHLSHKFSLTTASDFKWIGITMGTPDNMVTTLRQTLINFESNITPPFLNPNWQVNKKVWNTAVMNARHAADFATVLLLFQSSLKSVVFANVWHEQLGHRALQRITSAEREERKKLEKREKRERDDEEERNRLAFNYIKYSLGLKHQVWKQKGEEYRVHGQWGWQWLSSSRRCGIRARRAYPRLHSRVFVHYTMGAQNDVDEVVLVDPRTKRFMQQCESNSLDGQMSPYLPQEYTNVKVVEDVNKCVKGIIDVSKALNDPGRLYYPRLARKCWVDDLLERRKKLAKVEEQLSTKSGTDVKPIAIPSPSNVTANNKHTYLEKCLLRLTEVSTKGGSANVNFELVNSLAKQIQTVRLQFSQLNRFAKTFRCYTKECNTNSNAVSQITQNTCYSPLCLQKARAKKELLLLLRKAHTAGNGSKETVAAILGAVKKPSILEQKLTEGKRETNQLSVDESDDTKSAETEAPLDLLQDWEQARAHSVAFTDALLSDCLLIETDFPNNARVKKEEDLLPGTNTTADSSTQDSDKMDFIESMDVCSNVEIESTEDSIVTAINTSCLDASAEDIDMRLGSRRKRFQKSKKAYIGTKDVLDHTLDKDIPLKQNRRFRISSRPVKRDCCTKYEREYFENGKERVYSTTSPRGRVYLINDWSKLYDQPVKSEDKTTILKKATYARYPLISNFLTHKKKRSLLVLPRYELRKLARLGGRSATNGFHHGAKNNTIWQYQCSRPLFRTCWSYRTCNATTLSCIALQLRILWSCLRWDDMIAKPPSTDGKHQVTSETEIVTLELLKLRHAGRYGEKTSYLRRKVVIPLEMPKTIREVTSIRSGLRKRKRAESPQPTEPQISEEWVDEDKLELWEIKFIGEKQEKARLSTVTRSVASRQLESSGGNSPSTSTNGNPGGAGRVQLAPKPNEDVKEKMEQQLKLQRAAHQQRKVIGTGDLARSGTPVKGQIIGSRRVIVKNADGTTRIIQQAVTQVARAAPVTSSSAAASQTVQNTSTTQSTQSAPTPHKVQIIRGPDGKVSVRGLNPGQQLVQMPDGKLHVLTTSSNSATLGGKGKVLPIKSLPTPSSTAVTSTSSAAVASAAPIIKQMAVKHVAKPTGAQSIASQRVALPLAQIKNKMLLAQQQQASAATSSPPVQKIVSKVVNSSSPGQNMQQVFVQPGSKLVVGQNAQGQKVIISASAQSGTSAVQQQHIVQTQALPQQIQQAPQQQSQQMAINQVGSQPTQKVIQQIVNTSNVQQQIVIGGQRIILSPGQTIVTQRNVPQSQALQMVQQQIQTQQQQQQQQHIVQPQQQYVVQSNQVVQSPTTQTKLVKQLVVHQQTQQTVEEKVPINTTNEANETATQQVLVPNSTLAQQLAQGKLQVATVNGQQVIVKPLGNNQAQIVAHIKHQGDGNAHIVTNNTAPAVPQESPQSSPVKHSQQPSLTSHSPQQVIVQQQQIAQQCSYDTAASSIPQQHVAPSTVQPGQTQQQPMSVEESLLQNQPPGTVIKCVTAQVLQTEHGPRIVLQGLVGNDFTAQQLQLVQTQVKQQLMKAQESNGKLGVLGPTKIYLAVQPEATAQSQPPPLTPVHQSTTHQQPNIDNDTIGPIIINKAIDTGNELKHTICAQTDTSNIKINTQSIGVSALIEHDEKSIHINKTTVEKGVEENQNENFVITSGYIQESITNALKQGNLSPELEEKLVNMRKQQEQRNIQSVDDEDLSPRGSVIEDTFTSNRRSMLELQQNNDDLDWKTRTSTKRPNAMTTSSQFNRILKKSRNQKECIVDISEQKQSKLERHKELLKKSILRKRSLLERNLQNEIREEVQTKVQRHVRSFSVVSPEEHSENERGHIFSDRREDQNIEQMRCVKVNTSRNLREESFANNSRHAVGRPKKLTRKQEKLYCICRTPYDDTKFYVGCDLCSNWFHGDCVKITEEASKKLSEFICVECQKARETEELFCSCRQPYDDSQFYICCDKCQGWFHGRCVGILQSEAEFIDEYVCPECQRKTDANAANMKILSSGETNELKELIKQIQSHKSAWPFMEPVDPDEAPDYYIVIKEPMDLKRMETKLESKAYTKLADFIGDMTKIFDNCRYYNPKESSFYKCAEALESYFVHKLKSFRENVFGQRN